jgi:hypothetical protein
MYRVPKPSFGEFGFIRAEIGQFLYMEVIKAYRYRLRPWTQLAVGMHSTYKANLTVEVSDNIRLFGAIFSIDIAQRLFGANGGIILH